MTCYPECVDLLLQCIDKKLSIPVSKILIGLEQTLKDEWCNSAFINEQNVVMLFKILHEAFKNTDGAMLGKPKMLGAALYFAYSYLGSETGYPFTNFIVINNNDEEYRRGRETKGTQMDFWECVIELTDLSADMLAFHQNDNILKQLRNDLITC
jgi:hypothetical protein